MDIYRKSDMVYHDYIWSASSGDDPEIRGGLDHEDFNRQQGYEVLYTINRFLEINNTLTVGSGQKAEILLHERLPSKIYTHKEVWQWLTRMWGPKG